MRITVYTDASYEDELRIAVVGYLILIDGVKVKHTLYDYDGIESPTHAELMGVIIALQDIFELYNPKEVFVFCDCLGAFPRKKVMQKHKLKQYLNDLSDTIEVFVEYGIQLRFTHVKAHHTNQYNKQVDVSVRKRIRKLRKNHFIT